MDSFFRNSVNIIKQGQSKSGAFIACPNFPTYGYCWLRDGSFIAHAMDTAGEFASADAFFRWVGHTIQKYGAKVEDIRHRLDFGLPFGKDDVLHTRFSLDGEEVTVDNDWGNFQIDGYATWLWALVEHVNLSKDITLITDLAESIDITLQYLELVWQLPNYDCWEENPEYLHPYSLATVFAGFNSIASLIQENQSIEIPVAASDLAGKVKNFILKNGAYNGHLVKHIKPASLNGTPLPVLQSGVDSSLIAISVPFKVLPLDDPLVVETIKAIENDLHRPDGGIYRYKKDVYYGGGEWVLLTAWLGWYYACAGKIDQAQVLRVWVESKFEKDGSLPEQVSDHPLYPDDYQPWVNKWGSVATPLLWSHAMYIILVNAIQEGSK
jgi:GH15 family glucan-1,4-alpha-glucosidase